MASKCTVSGGLSRLLHTLYGAGARTGLPLCERAGSRTLRGATTVSGFGHETDAVFAAADLSVQVELKHLSHPVAKINLMIFNQKGLDFLIGGDPQLRRRPLYRMLVSGTPLCDDARRFALV